VLVTTPGDDTSKPLDQVGRPGVFVSTLRQALLAGEVDVIVHSYKDLPSAPEPGIVLAAVPGRVDPRDTLISRDGHGLAGLPSGAVVGTSSPRRSAALLAVRPDLELRPIRGNVDTRIRKVRDGEYDATVLAAAGLERIGRIDEVAEYLDGVLPAPAQGALAVECRADDTEMRTVLALLDDPVARLVTSSERQILIGVNAACTTPVAALAEYRDGWLSLRAELTENGVTVAAHAAAQCDVGDVPAARTVGMRAAAKLLAERGRPLALLVRAEGNGEDVQALVAQGIPALCDPYVRSAPVEGEAALLAGLLSEALVAGSVGDSWLIATSPRAVSAWLAGGGAALRQAIAEAAAAGMRAAATGLATADTLVDLGFADVFVPEHASAEDLVALLADVPPGRAFFPRSSVALRTLPDGLREHGWVVDEAAVYDTAPVPDRPGSAALVEDGTVDVVVLRAPSAVRALTAHARVPGSTLVVCSGRTTAQAAVEAGLAVAAVADSPAPLDLATAVSAAVVSRSGQ
jgi:hydroxymethylbilane synthase